jgi:hypothetical protein
MAGVDNAFRTVTFRIDAPGFDEGLPSGTDIARAAIAAIWEESFARVVKP